MSKKILGVLAGLMAAIIFQLTGMAGTAVVFIKMDKEEYAPSEQMVVSVFNAEEAGQATIEIIWENTGNIVYKEEIYGIFAEVKISAPENTGIYIFNAYIGQDRYSKSFIVAGANDTFALSGSLMENDDGLVVGIWVEWTPAGGNSQYRLKRMDNTQEEREYTNISTNYFIDTNISPNKTYRYVVYSDSGNSNEIIISAPEFVQSGYALSKNTRCLMLTVGLREMYNNGEKLIIDDDNTVVPVILNGRVVLPIRAVVEAMGGEVFWDDDTKTVILKAWGNTVSIPLDSYVIYVNGTARKFDTPATARNGRTFVPIRHVEMLGCEVEWISSSRSVLIKYPKS